MARLNFNISSTYYRSSDRVDVSFKLPSSYYNVKLYRRQPAGNFSEFAQILNASGNTTYTRSFDPGVVGGEFEIYIKAQKSSGSSAFDEDYGYVMVLPLNGSTVNTAPLTQAEITAYNAANYSFAFFSGNYVGGLLRTVLKSVKWSGFAGGIGFALLDPFGFAISYLTGWPTPVVGDYHSYNYSFVKSYISGTIKYYEYQTTINLMRKNANGVYQVNKTKIHTYNFPVFLEKK